MDADGLGRGFSLREQLESFFEREIGGREFVRNVGEAAVLTFAQLDEGAAVPAVTDNDWFTGLGVVANEESSTFPY